MAVTFPQGEISWWAQYYWKHCSAFLSGGDSCSETRWRLVYHPFLLTLWPYWCYLLNIAVVRSKSFVNLPLVWTYRDHASNSTLMTTLLSFTLSHLVFFPFQSLISTDSNTHKSYPWHSFPSVSLAWLTQDAAVMDPRRIRSVVRLLVLLQYRSTMVMAV